MGNVGERALTNIATPIARDKLPGLVSNLISRAINTFDRKTSGKELSEQKENLVYLFQTKICFIL